MSSEKFNEESRPKLSAMFRPYRGRIVGFVALASVAMLAETVAIGLLVPLMGLLLPEGIAAADGGVLARLTDGLSDAGIDSAWTIGAVLIALVVTKNVLTYAVTRYTDAMSFRFQRDVQYDIAERFTNADYGFIASANMGTMADMAFRVVARAGGMFTAGLVVIHSLIRAAAYVMVMVLVSWPLTIGVLIAAAGVTLANVAVVRAAQTSGERAANEEAEVGGFIHALLSGARTLRSYGQEAQEMARFKALGERVYRRRKTKSAVRAFPGPFSEVVALTSLVLALGLSARLLGSASLGEMAVFVVMLVRALPAVSGLNAARATIASDRTYADRISLWLADSRRTTMEDGSEPFASLREGVRFSGVSFAYPSRQERVLTNATFEIAAGKTTAIVGPSGAGKSTVLDLLLRLYDPTLGAVTVDGKPLETLRLADWRGAIGMVSQGSFLFHDTVRANIAYGKPGATDAEIERAVEQAAAGFVYDFPDGLDTVVGDRGLLVSGGQRQRLAIARALVRSPEILVFDEATSELDTQSERLIHDAVKQLQQDHTIVIVAHRLSTVRDADQILVLDAGAIAEQGTHEELLALGGIYHLLATQAQDPKD